MMHSSTSITSLSATNEIKEGERQTPSPYQPLTFNPSPMKSISNYLNTPSNIYKSVTKGVVILTHIICTLLCIVVAIAETHPMAAIFITAIIGGIVFLTKTTPSENKQ